MRQLFSQLLADESWTSGRGPRLLQIALTTFGILVLELALIRWISGQVRVLAYFNNLILIGCFLGMGAGFLAGRRRAGLVHLALPALALLSVPLAFSEQLGLLEIRFPDTTVYLWGSQLGGALIDLGFAFVAVVGIFAAVVAVFVLLGAATGHLLDAEKELSAYSADLVGSLVGVVGFAGVTALSAPPSVWIALGALPFAWLSRKPASLVALVVCVALAHVSAGSATFSPYNRIDVYETELGTTLDVNRDFHQYMQDLSDPGDNQSKQAMRAMYDMSWQLDDERGRALIGGAGTGNDVAAALRNGFQKVYAVDIDSRIVDIGAQSHPEAPYEDPRVTPVINDARAFLEQYEGEPFDVIAFGFVDSHAMFSALSSLRLDNYLYTQQAFESAWALLDDDGYIALNLSFAGGPWMLERLYFSLAEATGRMPVVIDHGVYRGAAALIAAKDPKKLHWEKLPTWPRFQLDADRRSAVRTTSDDWPFLYLRPDTIPWGYLLVLCAVLAIAFVLVRRVSRPDPKDAEPGKKARALPFDWTLFFMGAGFLLLETRGVTSLSLLFGSTWVVNAAVFSGVLVMALLANVFVQRFSPRRPVVPFVLLFASLALLYVVDVASLNQLSLINRGLVGGLLTGLPVGFAGVIVSMMLARSGNLASGLAANLLGSVVGGCVEYLSMFTGLRALVLLAMAFYLAAMLSWRRGEQPEAD